MKVLIVGGVAGGASAAARLRRLNEDFQIIMFEKGEHISFANCGLPYYIGDVIKEKEHLLVQTPQAMQKRFKIDVRVLNEVIDVDLEKKEVEVYDHKTKERYKESYDKLLLSPGASPFKPRGINGPNVFTLRNIPDTYAIKDYVDSKNVKRAVVVGGGFIGLEVAENLQERGVKTTVVQLGNQIIGPLDFEMAALVHSHLKEKGIELYLETEVVDIQHQDDYSEIQLSGDKKIKADMIVLGIGVRPEVELAKRAGLEIGQLGGIVVDEYLRTSNPDIYAVGDAVEVVDFINGNKTLIPLAGPANKQGRIAANNLSGLEEKYRGTQGTSVLKVFDMTVAFTGNNEKTLKRFAIPYQKSFTHSSSHAGYYPGAMPISLKIIFSPDNGKILGAQAVGYEGVEKRIDVIATAIRAGMTVSDLEQLELSYAPPYSSAKDPVNMAGYVANNILKGDCQVIHWHEIEKNKDYLIDVRTPQEFNLGTIEGAVNIPLDHLRDRLGEVPQDKEVVIFCQVGLRGYLAYRILVQKGYKNIKNLSGGYKTYSATIKKQSNPDLYDYDSLGDEKKKELIISNANELKAHLQIDACGLQCPGPIMQVNKGIGLIKDGEVIEVSTTDPAFLTDIQSWCQTTGNKLLETKRDGKKIVAYIRKGKEEFTSQENSHDKTMVVFSGDLDKAMASFIIANGACAMGRKVTMFFTFWGLNILRKHDKVRVKKNFLETMFGMMMPRGTKKLGLSKMNMGGMGSMLIRYIMNKKNVSALDELIEQAKSQGVRLVACSMSMDVMGIKEEELIDGVELGGVAAYLTAAESADTNLFI